jgi:KipI family sensor histidine kinase inhibitor
MQHRILNSGDTAFTIEFGNAINPAVQAAVDALDHAIARAHADGEIPGLIETVPTFRSLTVIYDPLLTHRAALLASITPLAQSANPASNAPPRVWRLPACYTGDAGPDLDDTARALDLTTTELVALHAQTDYVVYMLGFLPGFPFMGDLPDTLRLPRRTEPRVRVPAGSIAIAAGLTAIYPWESPGGWHLLGRCPVPLFNPARSRPALLQAGDHVRFEPVSTTECERIERASASGEIDSDTWCAPHPEDA